MHQGLQSLNPALDRSFLVAAARTVVMILMMLRCFHAYFVKFLQYSYSFWHSCCSMVIFYESYAALSAMSVAHSALLTYNAALNRPAYQSSVYVTRYGSFNANLANDGIHETDATKDSKPRCSISNRESNPWWAVDLGRPTTVYRVDLTNRGDAGGV